MVMLRTTEYIGQLFFVLIIPALLCACNVWPVKPPCLASKVQEENFPIHTVIYEEAAVLLITHIPSRVSQMNSAQELRSTREYMQNFIDRFCRANYIIVRHQHEQMVRTNELVGSLGKTLKFVNQRLKDPNLYDSFSHESSESLNASYE